MEWLSLARVDEVADLPAGDPGDLFTNEDPSLAKAWHPVAVIGESPEAVRLMGRTFQVPEQWFDNAAHLKLAQFTAETAS